jgi:hypothetical protein
MPGLFFMQKRFIFIPVLLVVLIAFPVSGQRRGATRPKPPEQPLQTAKEPAADAKPAVKKNARGESKPPVAEAAAGTFTHIYEFTRPDFLVSRVAIRHDDKGIGEIQFSKSGADEAITDPIRLSTMTLARIDAALSELRFLDSKEHYQFEKDYSHLGTMTFTLHDGDRSRTVSYNWTNNKAAKALMDEYRKIGHQYIWMFDMGLSRENQPLDAPRLMTALDGYLRRGEISDPEQMLPFLTGLSSEERIPMIARNHAEQLVARIKKQTEKAKK